MKKPRVLTVRFPEELYKELKAIAEEEERSINQQILYCVKIGFAQIQNSQSAQ